MKPRTLCVSLFLLLTGCVERPNQVLEDNVENINVPNSRSHDEFDISKIYSSNIELIPLKSQDNFMIANIDKIEMRGDRFFVLDREQSNTLFVFDREGNPIMNFLSVNDFSFNEMTLFLLDSKKNSIAMYNGNTMKMQKKIDLTVSSVSEIAYAGDNLLCYRETGNEESQLLPYYFLAEKDQSLSTIFIPNKNLPYLTESYLNYIFTNYIR